LICPLVHEFTHNSNWPIIETCQVFHCQCDQILRHPFNPFRYWLRRYFNQTSQQSELRNKHAFNRKLNQLIDKVADSDLAKELNRGRSFLGALVDLHWENSLYSQLDPQGRFEKTLQVLKNLIIAESQRYPLILILEDAQWLDPNSIKFIQRLIWNAEQYPFSIIATARPTGGDILGKGVSYQSISLSDLPRDALSILVTDRLGAPADDELMAILNERANGNPFFAEQILLYLRNQESIKNHNGQWYLVDNEHAISLPMDVRTIFVARCDRLGQEVRDVVQAASVLGREFEVQVLSEMLQNTSTLSTYLTVAEEQKIWSALSQIRYTFRHALLRDTVYKMQLRAQRRVLHRLAAEALMKLYADDLTPHVAEIAHHYEAAYLQGLAEMRKLATDYLLRAAEQAEEAYENAIAIDYYTRALALIPQDAYEKRFEMSLARHTLYHRQGRREEEQTNLAELEQLVDTLQDIGKQGIVALYRAEYHEALSQYQEAIDAAQSAIAATQATQDTDTEVRGNIILGTALWRQGNLDAAYSIYTHALQLARVIEHPWAEANALRYMGIILYFQGQYDQARECCEQALTLSHASQDRELEAHTLNTLGLLPINGETTDGEQHYFEAALAIYHDIGDRSGESMTLINLGAAADSEGNYDQSIAYYKSSQRINQELGDRRSQTIVLSNLGNLLSNLGQYDQASMYYETALTIAQTIGSLGFQAIALKDLGALAHNLGQYEQAQEYAEQALALAHQSGHRSHESQSLSRLGSIAYDLGQYNKALEYHQAALAITEQSGYAPIIDEQQIALGWVMLALEQYEIAENYFRQVLVKCHERNDMLRSVEALAGLAQLELKQGDRDEALAWVEESLPVLAENPTLQGLDYPFHSLWALCQVLLEAGDPRGVSLHTDLYTELKARGAQIKATDIRRSYLSNVHINREIIARYQALYGASPSGEPKLISERVITSVLEPVKVITVSATEQSPQPHDHIVEVHSESTPTYSLPVTATSGTQLAEGLAALIMQLDKGTHDTELNPELRSILTAAIAHLLDTSQLESDRDTLRAERDQWIEKYDIDTKALSQEWDKKLVQAQDMIADLRERIGQAETRIEFLQNQHTDEQE